MKKERVLLIMKCNQSSLSANHLSTSCRKETKGILIIPKVFTYSPHPSTPLRELLCSLSGLNQVFLKEILIKSHKYEKIAKSKKGIQK